MARHHSNAQKPETLEQWMQQPEVLTKRREVLRLLDIHSDLTDQKLDAVVKMVGAEIRRERDALMQRVDGIIDRLGEYVNAAAARVAARQPGDPDPAPSVMEVHELERLRCQLLGVAEPGSPVELLVEENTFDAEVAP